MRSITKSTGLFLIVILFLTGCVSSTSQNSKKVKIILASAFADDHILWEAGKHFAGLINMISDYRIKIEVKPAAGSEEDINIACEKGEVQMQATGGEPLEV